MERIELEKNIAQMQELSKDLCNDVKAIRNRTMGLAMAKSINTHARSAILANVMAVSQMQMLNLTKEE